MASKKHCSFCLILKEMEVPPPEESNGAIFLSFSGVEFLGCSEAKYAHSYGCDREKQAVDVRSKEDKKVQVIASRIITCIHSQVSKIVWS